mmetsp:Transcript_6751/g.15591  ORF Transcript_6751/g.15591 Transcript_6751/m.15591 type:complete len:201 (-) Transcript_6751:458-1060(-)
MLAHAPILLSGYDPRHCAMHSHSLRRHVHAHWHLHPTVHGRCTLHGKHSTHAVALSQSLCHHSRHSVVCPEVFITDVSIIVNQHNNLFYRRLSLGQRALNGDDSFIQSWNRNLVLGLQLNLCLSLFSQRVDFLATLSDNEAASSSRNYDGDRHHSIDIIGNTSRVWISVHLRNDHFCSGKHGFNFPCNQDYPISCARKRF